MKSTHTLPNGTVLEIGKRYGSEKWKGYIEVQYLGESNFVFITGFDGQEPVENTIDYTHANDIWNLQPYNKHKKKVKIAKYAYYSNNRWYESDSFHESDEDFKRRYGDYIKFIRLKHTEIEVKEY